MKESGGRARAWGRLRILACLVAAAVAASAQTPVGTAFTYQGRLTDGGNPASGSYDLEFKLFDAASAGSQVGGTLTRTAVTVTNGLLTVTLDFGGGAFAGSARWLEIGVRPGGSSGAFTLLSARQELTPGPNATYAGNAGQLGGQAPAHYLDLSNHTGVLSVPQGGTGATTVEGARAVLGEAPPRQVPLANSLSAVDSAGNVAFFTSITIGTDGLPVISYWDVTNLDLKVAKCNDAACSGAEETLSTVDSTGFVGQYTSITIGTDGLPVISYHANLVFDLKVAKCNDVACSGADETLSTVDSAGSVGQSTSITIGVDGLPVISYLDNTNGDLKVAKCNDVACSGGDETLSIVDSAGTVGPSSSITIGTDGLPVISYYDVTNFDLKVAKCNDAACSGADETLSTVDSAGNAGDYTSITIGTDGLPVISYWDGTNGDLKVAKCNDAACAGANETLSTVDSAGDVGHFTSITIGTDGLPLISYYDLSNTNLKVAKCNDVACSGADETLSTVDTAFAGEYTSITIGTDGLPVISYRDIGNGDLKAAKCANASCLPGFRAGR